jgi:integrase
MAPKKILFLHRSGQWAKRVKIDGVWRTKYFGKDEVEALKRYAEQEQYLEAGILPPRKGEPQYASVRYCFDAFLESKQRQADLGRIKQRTVHEWKSFLQLAAESLGKVKPAEGLRGDDFDRVVEAYSKRWGPVRQLNAIRTVRAAFKFALEEELIDRPVRFGQNFSGPKKRELRLHRATKGERMLEPRQLRSLINEATGCLKPAILLGVNCGFIPVDVVRLRPQHIAGGYINLVREKTGILRRCPIWPETQAALADCPPPLTSRRGNPLIEVALSQLFRKLVDKLGFYRLGVNFAMLRHVHQTIGELSGDSVAVKHTMGHSEQGMSETYRERFPDDRRLKVTNTIRAWLYDE